MRGSFSGGFDFDWIGLGVSRITWLRKNSALIGEEEAKKIWEGGAPLEKNTWDQSVGLGGCGNPNSVTSRPPPHHQMCFYQDQTGWFCIQLT
jgi:hypothetical protein